SLLLLVFWFLYKQIVVIVGSVDSVGKPWLLQIENGNNNVCTTEEVFCGDVKVVHIPNIGCISFCAQAQVVHIFVRKVFTGCTHFLSMKLLSDFLKMLSNHEVTRYESF